MHDGSVVRFSKVAPRLRPARPAGAPTPTCRPARRRGEVPTGLLYVDERRRDMHDINGTTDVPLSQVPFEKLCPGSAALEADGRIPLVERWGGRCTLTPVSPAPRGGDVA